MITLVRMVQDEEDLYGNRETWLEVIEFERISNVDNFLMNETKNPDIIVSDHILIEGEQIK